ncbi:hypothetical protein [Methylopila sp. Yamaguchi]|uniref:hypothetical protein n=1 Tax=Methylopila sp. Yamaguchi TaxID=1437817 RepID=UPI0011AEE452|nr:hypothetical protein [Methylopila sp. Yamaguchi]
MRGVETRAHVGGMNIDRNLTILAVCCVTLGAALGMTVHALITTPDPGKWMEQWGGFLGALIGAAATIAAGALAWFSATRPERLARHAIRDLLVNFLAPLAAAWEGFGLLEREPSVGLHSVIGHSLQGAFARYDSEAILRQAELLPPSERRSVASLDRYIISASEQVDTFHDLRRSITEWNPLPADAQHFINLMQISFTHIVDHAEQHCSGAQRLFIKVSLINTGNETFADVVRSWIDRASKHG